MLIPLVMLPIGNLAWRAAAPQGAPSLDTALAVLRGRAIWDSLVVTTGQATLSTLLAAAIGLPLAYLLSQFRFPGDALLRFTATVPLILPAIVIALAFRELFALDGWLNDAVRLTGGGAVQVGGTLWAVVAAHGCFGVAVFVRVVGDAWARLDPRGEEAARVLGATRRRSFRHVTLPQLLPAVRVASALVFAASLTSLAAVLLLGGPGLETIEVKIYRLVAGGGSLSYAAALAAIQLVVTMIVIERGGAVPGRRVTTTAARGSARPLSQASWRERLVALLAVLAVLLLTVAPIAALIAAAVVRGAGLDDGTLRALRWSLAFAAGAAPIAVGVGVLAGIAAARAEGRRGALLRRLLAMPLAVTACALAVGYLATFDGGVAALRGTPWLVLLAHATIAMPVVLRPVAHAVRGVVRARAEAAATLGAGSVRAWVLVAAPQVVRAVVVGALFAFTVSLGELGAALLLRGPGFTTAPVAILDALGTGNAAPPGPALALAVILISVAVVAFVFIEQLRSRDAGEY